MVLGFEGYPLQLGGNVQGFKILKVILYLKNTKYDVSKTQATQPPALQKTTNIITSFPSVILLKILRVGNI